DVEGIPAGDAVGDPLFDKDLNRPFLPLERSLADAGQAGVGGQADEEIVAQPGIGEKGLEALDLHAGSPSFAATSPSTTASPLAIDCWMASTRATAAAPSRPVADSFVRPRIASRTFSSRPA